MGRRSEQTPPAPPPETTPPVETPAEPPAPPPVVEPPPETTPAADVAPAPSYGTLRASSPAHRLVNALLAAVDALVEIRDDATDPEKVQNTGLLANALLEAGASLPGDWTGHTLRHALLAPSTNAPADPEGFDQFARAFPTLLGCFVAARRLHRQGIDPRRDTGATHLARVAAVWPRHTSKADCDAEMGEQVRDEEQARHRRHAEAHEARRELPRFDGPSRQRNSAPIPDEPPDLTVG